MLEKEITRKMKNEFVGGRAYVYDLSLKDRNELTLLYGDDQTTEAFDVIQRGSTTYYRVPRYYKPEYLKLENYMTDGADVDISLNPEFKPLNEKQERAINSIVNNEHGLVSARVGFGKTFVAIAAMSQIKKRTLIVAHVSTVDGLLDQWENSIVKYTNLTENDIGRLTSSTKVIDKPVYLTTVQTLISRVKRDDPEFAKMMYDANFGVTFFDECHISASGAEFSKATTLCYSRRIYGLSATLERKDNLKNLLFWNMGNVIYSDDEWFVVPLKVALIDIPMKLGGYANYMNYGTASSFSSKYATFLSKRPDYIKTIAEIVDAAIEANRNPLVLSSQINIMKLIQAQSKYPDKISVVHGSVKNKDYTKQCIIATLGMFKVGMDVPRLDTLIFATPLTAKNGLIQAIGRVARVDNNNPKKYSIIVDITNSMYSKTEEMRRYRTFYYNELDRHATNGCIMFDDIDTSDFGKMFEYIDYNSRY